jgi:hypothetical protein
MMSAIERLRRLPRYGFPPSYHLAQFPNAPLAVAIAGVAAEHLTHDRAHDYASAVATIGFGVWAWLELAEGDNAFRRVLGVAGLAYAVSRIV